MPRPAPRAPRQDPTERPVALFDQEDGTALENADPALHYVYVDPADRRTLGRYLKNGFFSVTQEKGGVTPIGGLTVEEGAEITFEDQVLLACSQERWTEIQEGGFTGNKGKKRAAALEQRILKPAGQFEDDGFRGRGIDFEGKGANS
jgi:hypothetical protein